MSLAIYRKYRPKSLSDLLGQEIIVEVLRNAAKSDKLAHAYLFYGPRGSGKTTTARLIAKIANCQRRQTDEKFKTLGEPCNECQFCQEIDEGRALDVIEIDAASNRGIDEIRNLKEGIKYSPTSFKYKVYIIDECHQLTKEAFNALLKTLEEPPAHAIFILATTEYEKMPATIISRTQRFHFKRLPLLKIVEKLKSIANAEKIKADDEALELIAASAEGSLRDAESLLEQIASLEEEKISLDEVEKIIGRVGFLKTAGLAELLLKNNLEGSLNSLSAINEGGYNLVQFNKDLIHYFRRVLSLKFSPALETEFKKELTETELNSLKKHSQIINSPADEQKIINLIKSLIRAYTEMKYSPFPIVPLEVAIIENLKS
ncbi:DNA polymerase III, subunit gamma and tau [Candidatus Wolfebacteria bacterium RIFCSPLOWO2_01_FULL_38_11]|uniref:DNA polymerase III subunit gamma/tau n=1 Tax=Candidatus Wolfebacteria bacterium RIFCSPLOWO2_01_FULL_38_11 TaxID=1802556 RepID=A0A1F8DRY7_9BACT|nr:MAG: DNA polymerase III, subunit gamma and tau [Candidatus Wolfebacteria bacterium RIFCSPLOWO2_01_FULL_38_11]